MASLIVALAISLVWCLLAIWLGPRIGFVDTPDAHLKTHEHVAVPLGGVGVFFAVHVASLMEGGVDGALFASTALVLVLGLIDDRVGLTPWMRLTVETVAAVILVVGSSTVDSPVMSVLAVALVVFAVNAVNLYDGLDGLAASAALVAALGAAVLASVNGVPTGVSLPLAAALAGFLVVGWHPARVFLGDSGAYVIGVMLASVLIDTSEGDPWSLVASGSLLGVFALDLLVTLIRRRRSRKPLFAGDRSHVYDQLRDRGMSVPRVAMVSIAAQVVLVGLALVVLVNMSPIIAALVMAAAMGLLVALLARYGFLGAETG